MKILCVIDSLGSGGAQRQLVQLATGFKESGHTVEFLVYHNINFFKEKLKNAEIEVITIIEKNYFKRLVKIRKVIRSGKFDSVLSFLEAPNFICELACIPIRKWKLVVGERNADPNILSNFKLRAYRWFHFFSDCVIANSFENIKMVKKINPFLPSRKCHVIYNIVDFKLFRYSSQKKRESKFKLIIISSHQYHKNLDGLIEAVNLLSNEYKDKLLIDWYGGESKDNSKEQGLNKIQSYGLNNVFNFYPPTNEIAERINESDALGHFSFYEGMPNAVCEAMSLGKPVICSSISDVPLLIKDKNLLFDPADNGRIKDVISRLMSLSDVEIREICKNNLEVSKQMFDKRKIVEEYLKYLG